MKGDEHLYLRSFFPWQAGVAVVASLGLAYVFFDLTANRHIFGGTKARSASDPAWWAETSRLFDEGWPRQASENPVVMNPISRQNYRKVEK